ncbi:MAG: LAGLIDADG family homing endonuclease, partial [Candidatus Diapherotrites archaeon]|nr:LAGLIDADG family homing endonuclease [Candidatus Diapherotrites archaeon]
ADTVACVQSVFGVTPTIRRPHKTEIQVRINNGLVAEFLDNIGVGIGAKNKRVPSLVYNLSIENQKEFLRGYFAGDGYHYKNNPKGKGYLAAKTASPQLGSDLAYLLLQHGIVARLKGPFIEPARELNGQHLKESIAYKIYLAEKEFEKIERPIGHTPYALPIKEIRLEELRGFITDPKLKKAAQDYVYNNRTKDRKLVGILQLQKMFPKTLKAQNPVLKTLHKFLYGDLGVEEIVEIKEIEKPEFEYDLSVPGTENFVGGFGGVCLHNSGHSDRNQLVNYLRNLRPKPKRVLTNHGNKHKTIEFAKYVQTKFHTQAQAPHNLDSIRLT